MVKEDKNEINHKASAVKDNMFNEVIYEFGGPKGCLIIMLYSHFLPYFFWLCLELNNGGILYPKSFSATDISDLLIEIKTYTVQNAIPNSYSISIYLGFLAIQALFYVTMPGVWIKGLPVPTEGNKRHDYLCNGAVSWWVTLISIFLLDRYNIFTLQQIAYNFGRVMSTAIIFSDLLAIIIFYAAKVQAKAIRMSNNFIYDFFMGAYLNPRIGYFDFKMWAEIRVSWILLFMLTLSASVTQYREAGQISYSMILILTAHFLYTNACMKGEECIPTTWDIYYEKWGWMLVYWNLAGVPFVYCFQSFYILKNDPQLNQFLFYFLFVLLLCAYYVWDTAQSQKNRFKMQLKGTYVRRYTFPQLPWGTIDNPNYLKTECGDVILLDGWWKYARKIHYTADIIMSSIWALSCGFSGILPFYYPIFFFFMIRHRAVRDQERCMKKYKKDWEKYCELVPYVWIPGII